ncbi:unnamed protein product [Pedinophyceae sp. YPF-701]|nr:unnamed protein product [Pedinophyceae sp. YPF-701]
MGPRKPNPSDLSDPASSSALEEYADLPASAITPPDSPRAALEHQQRPVSDQVADIAEEDPFQDTVGSGGVLMGSVRSALKDVIVRGWRDVPWEPAPPAPAPNEAEAAISPASSMQMNGAELPQDVNEAVWALLEGAHVGGIPPRPRGGGSRGVPPPAMMQAALALAIGELRDARAGAREQAEGDGGWGSEGAERRGTRVFREVDEKDAEAVREELAGLRAQLRARDTEREAAEAALREALAGMQGRAEAAEGTVGSLRAQLRALQEQLTWNNEKVEDERAAMAVEMDEAVLEERKKVEKAQGEIAELQRALEGAWREARLARERAQAADARREEAEAVHTILAGKVAEAERKAAAASDEVERTHRAAQGALRRAKDLEEVLAREKDARALAERSERRALRRIAEQVALESERGLALTQAQGLRSRAAEVDAVRVVTELSPAPAEGPRAGEGDVGELEVPEGSSMGELRAAMHYVGDKVLDAKRAEAEAARREARQAEEAFEVWRERETASALAHAPRHLRPLGVAARFLVCAGPGSAAARVAKRLAADLGRTHATRLELASDDSGSSSGPLPPAPAVPLAHRMVVVVGRQSGTDADANSPAWRTLAARLMEALRCNAQVLLVTEAPAEAHRGGCTADVAAAAKVLESKYVRAAQALLAAESNTRVEAGVALGAGAPGAGRLWDKAVSAIRAHGGVPDAALMELPAEELRRLRPRGEAERALGARVEGSPAKGALVPVSAIDFVGLTGIRHLDISLSGPGGAAWISALPALLARGGAALTQLSLRDCPSDAAAADVADALVGAECPPKTAGFNVALPLRGLVEGTVRDVDATGGPGAQAEDVLLLCRVVEKCESLRSLAVAGRAQSATAGAPEPRWRRLAAAVLAHPQMRRVNGIRIERGEDGTAELTGVIQDKVGLFGPVLQLEGAEVGPLGCALVAKWLAGESGTVPGGVEVIDLNGCSVGCAGLAAFAKAFRDAGAEDHAGPGASVRILRIRRDSFVSPRGASALKALLSACPGLARLDLSACAIGDDGARAIAAALPVCGARLVDVSLGTNRVGAAGARALAAAIGEGHTPELRVLDLQGNVVGDSGAAELATALQRQAAAEGGGAVECLRLADNYSIGAEGARAMGELAAASAALETLDLSRNHLGPEGARALARGLRRSRGLATLDLRWCKLRAEGVTHICEALGGGAGQAPPIRALDLARNNIGDRGAAAVATMLRKGVPSLATLDLATNAIGLEGFRQLSLAVREGGTQLGSLCLEGNQMDTGGRQRLEEAVRKAAKARAAAAAQGVDRPMSAATSQRAAVAEA